MIRCGFAVVSIDILNSVESMSVKKCFVHVRQVGRLGT